MATQSGMTIQSRISSVLIALVFFVSGIQCCHMLFFQSAQASAHSSSEKSAMSCHQKSTGHISEHASHKSEEHLCQCDSKQEKLLLFSLVELDDASALFQLGQIVAYSNSERPFRSVHSLSYISSRAPPAETLPLHIQSTVLLI